MEKRKNSSKASVVAFYRIVILFATILLVLGVSYLFKQTQNVCANAISCIKDLSGTYEDDETKGQFMGNSILIPHSIASSNSSLILGETTGSNKHIYIDLTSQRLYAKEGDAIIHEFPISSGKWGQTPTGDFKIWIKLRYTRMKGGKKELGTYYDLPNVPYTMFFYNDEIPKWRGYGIHGAYWHNNFGHPMSHGCINVSPQNAELVYNWANPSSGSSGSILATDENPGTPITIYGKSTNQ